jgi:D-arabinose 1-dehydrogenase-like Zn-dependent alcohol dehydrogenase
VTAPRWPLEASNDVFERMRQGTINGRIVLALGD